MRGRQDTADSTWCRSSSCALRARRLRPMRRPRLETALPQQPIVVLAADPRGRDADLLAGGVAHAGPPRRAAYGWCELLWASHDWALRRTSSPPGRAGRSRWPHCARKRDAALSRGICAPEQCSGRRGPICTGAAPPGEHGRSARLRLRSLPTSSQRARKQPTAQKHSHGAQGRGRSKAAAGHGAAKCEDGVRARLCGVRRECSRG